MDSLTHLVLGHAMGALAKGATPAIRSAAYWGAFVGNSLPDIDVPVGYLFGRGWGFHRKFTHTIPGMLGLSLAAAAIITLSIPGSSFGLTLAWTLAGTLLHVLLDCHNLFGVRPLWPFSNKHLGWGVLFILDPLILISFGLGDVAHLVGWIQRPVLLALFGANAIYIAARWWAWLHLSRRLIEPGVSHVTLAPHFLLWRYLREKGANLEYGEVRLMTGRLTTLESVQPARGPIVDASALDPEVKAFLGRARYPFAQVEAIGQRYRVIWQDLFTRLRGQRGGLEVWVDRESMEG